uniref:F-box domain-containing protein n=1 Tax=Syphacia muris TaxID=451379 RepID=A0A0N5ACG0_9BILA
MAAGATTSRQASVAFDDTKPPFWNLPNELTIKICSFKIFKADQPRSRSMCPAYKQLKMRQICQHWRHLHDKYLARRSKVYRLKLTVFDDKVGFSL